MEKTVELEVLPLLPGVSDQNDECYLRLERQLQGHKNLIRAHLERERYPAKLCLHYDPELISLPEVNRLAGQAGSKIVSRYHHDILKIEGMDCADCALVLQHGIERVDGVLEASVSYPMKIMRIEYDGRKVNRSFIEKRIRALGYAAQENGFAGWYRENRELLFSLLAGLFLLAGWLGATFAWLPLYGSLIFYAMAYVFGGWDITRHTWGTLKAGAFNTDLLMVVAALGAAALGEYAEGSLLIFLFSLGHALEERALDKARNAVRALSDLTPKTALVQRGDQEAEVPVEELVAGDIVIVRPGVRLPADGLIAAGQSALDQAPVTGESIPVEKQPGDQVYAGTINGQGALEVKVTRPVSDSTLARVMKMVEEAQTQKSPTQQIIERFTGVFVPAVLGVTLLVILVPPMFGIPFKESFLRAMTLLVAASPCALALGTPSAVLSAVAQAARNGILVKGGAHLENLGRVKAIALDKTGTLTCGRPEVTDILSLDGSTSQDEVLRLAARLESRSGHPLAAAVMRLAKSRRLAVDGVSQIESLTGQGLRAIVDGRPVWIGNEKLMAEPGVAISQGARQELDALQAAGKTVILVARENALMGLIALADTLRPEVPETVAHLKRLGIAEIVMLSGDHRPVAEAIARQAGATRFYADLMPEQKLEIIRKLAASQGQVAMVGDGVNDAPALANATVGIAMGGAGTDVALETADVALMGDDLTRLPFAVGLGRATRAIITQNLWIALSVIGLLAVTSLAGLAGIGMAIFIHEGSTLVVVLNSLRLLAYRQE